MENRLKPLLLIVPALPDPPTTGGEIFNQRLVTGLTGAWDLTVVTLKDLSLTTQASEEEFALRLAEFVVGRAEPGPVFVDTYLHRQFDSAFARLRTLGFGPIVGFGQAWYPGRYQSFLSRMRVQARLMRMLRRLDHHVVVSESLKADYVRRGIFGARIDVVLPGFNVPEPAPVRVGSLQGPLRVRIAGTYMPAKGQHLVVEALEHLAVNRPDLVGRIAVEAIGSKTQAPEFVRDLEERAKRLPAGLLKLTGPMPQSDLWKAFGTTDVFVFPAIGEGLGMVVVEAMLCGAFPLVSPDGPLVEVVGEAGLVVPRDGQAIARALIALAADPSLSARKAKALARAQAIAPTWSQSVGRVSDAVLRAANADGVGQYSPRVGPLGRLALRLTGR